MSKSKQNRKGKAKRRAGSPKRRRSVSGGRRFDQALHRFREGDEEDAKRLLLEWEQESALPTNALSLLMEVCYREHDLTTYARAALALSNRQPEEAERTFVLPGDANQDECRRRRGCISRILFDWLPNTRWRAKCVVRLKNFARHLLKFVLA